MEGLSSSGSLAFEVNFTQTGTHYVWVRAIAEDFGSNSVWVSLDDGTEVQIDCPVPSPNLLQWCGFRHDVQQSIIVGDSGVHTVKVSRRETGFIVDKVVVTPSASDRFEPTEMEPPES